MQSFGERRPSPYWHPQVLVLQVGAMSIEQVVVAFERVFFLVVRLDEFSSALGAGLKAADANQTFARPLGDTGSVSIGPDFITKLTPPSAAGVDRAAGQPLDYPADLLESECHVVRIRKRTRNAPGPMVSVGRTADQDIPLQHPSVSKLHALLEWDGDLHVTDAGSLNRTFVNGEMIQARTRLRSGDSVKFGAVRCAVCSPVGLWRAVQAARSPRSMT
jgi:hypothetical protein